MELSHCKFHPPTRLQRDYGHCRHPNSGKVHPQIRATCRRRRCYIRRRGEGRSAAQVGCPPPLAKARLRAAAPLATATATPPAASWQTRDPRPHSPPPIGSCSAQEEKTTSPGAPTPHSPSLLDHLHSCGHTRQQQGRLPRTLRPRRCRSSAREVDRVCRMIDLGGPPCSSSCFWFHAPMVNTCLRLCRLVAAPGGSDFGSTQEFMADDRCAAARAWPPLAAMPLAPFMPLRKRPEAGARCALLIEETAWLLCVPSSGMLCAGTPHQPLDQMYRVQQKHSST